MRRLFRQAPVFSERIDELGDDQLLGEIEDLILEDPLVGATVAGAGGVRKLRVRDRARGKGKRGGLRVLYLDLPHKERTYLLYLYGKDEAEDITASEKKVFQALVLQLKGEER